MLKRDTVVLNVLVVNDSHVMGIKETTFGYEEEFIDPFFVPHTEKKTYLLNLRRTKAEPCVIVGFDYGIDNEKKKKVREQRLKYFGAHSDNENAIYMNKYEPQLY